jgi:hypothetical protein
LRGSGIAQLPLPLQRLDARDVASHRANARRIGQLARSELKAQLEQFFAELFQSRFRIRDRIGGLTP